MVEPTQQIKGSKTIYQKMIAYKDIQKSTQGKKLTGSCSQEGIHTYGRVELEQYKVKCRKVISWEGHRVN